MLEVKQLSRHYGDFCAVSRVNFSIETGEIVGLLGHNGAGKTTIMKMLSGYLEPSGGDIVFDGKLFSDDTKHLQRYIGYLPENLPVYADMSVGDYLDYAAELKQLRGKEKQQEIKRALKATDITDKLLAPIATLSRGYKQRVGVAQALLGRPKLLILDEPTNGLDPTQTQHMRELICDLAKDATVILSTHIMQEVEAICSRVLMIKSGQLVIDSQLAALQEGRSVYLSCNLSLGHLQHLLVSESAIQRIEAVQASDYRIAVHPEQDARAVCAAIAKALITAGAELYQLHIETHNLERLFREVNTKEVIRHAA